MSEQTIGRYQLNEQIGRGGMAIVYRGYDPRFKREVAIKVMTVDFMSDALFRARFEREAQTIAALEHPAIVPVYDFGEEQDRPYLVMRLMNGGTLTDKLRQGSLPVTETTRILQRLGAALERAHRRGIVHRDLKPSNIMFDEYGDAFLGDFGIARLTETAVTLTGDSVIGTPAYMSPEQANGDKELDSRSDIYALGVICFEMLTGERPFQADTAARLMIKHILEPAPDVRQLKPDLAPGVGMAIARAMAKEPDQRFATATELSDTLARALQGAPATPSSAPTVPEIDPQHLVARSPIALHATGAVHPETEVAGPPLSLLQKPQSGNGRRLTVWLLAGAAVLIALLLLLAGGLLLLMNREWLASAADRQHASTPTIDAFAQATPRPTFTPRPSATPDLRPLAEEHMQQFYRYLEEDEYLLALEQVDTALDLVDDPWYYHEKAYVLFLLRSPEQGLNEINIAITADLENAHHYNLRGLILRVLGNHELALADHLRAVEMEPREAHFWHELAHTHRSAGDHEAAVTAWEMAITLSPAEFYYLIDMAQAYVDLGNSQTALAVVEGALEEFPNQAELLEMQIDLYIYHIGDAEMALRLLNQALLADPDNPRTYDQLGQLYLHRLGEPAEALGYFNQALSLDDTLYWVYGHRGISYRDLGDYEAALADFRRAIVLEPNDPWPHMEIGWIFLDYLDEPAQALLAFDQALTIDRELADGHLGRGRALLAAGYSPPEALTAWNSCIDIAPDQYWCYWLIARFFQDSDQISEAVDYFHRFLELIPDDDCLECQQHAQEYIDAHK